MNTDFTYFWLHDCYTFWSNGYKLYSLSESPTCIVFFLSWLQLLAFWRDVNNCQKRKRERKKKLYQYNLRGHVTNLSLKTKYKIHNATHHQRPFIFPGSWEITIIITLDYRPLFKEVSNRVQWELNWWEANCI